MAAQAALAKHGVAVLILPVDISKATAPDEPAFTVHHATPLLRPSDAELDPDRRDPERGQEGCDLWRLRLPGGP